MPADRILFRPARSPGAGTGHLRRCAGLAEELGEKASAGPSSAATLVVVDARTTSRDELTACAALGTPVLLDEGGSARKFAPYLIDAIPGPRAGEANISSPGLMNLPERERFPDPGGPILVSFGGEDPAGLTLPVLRTLIEKLDVSPERLTITLPPDGVPDGVPDAKAAFRKVSILAAPEGLKNLLGGYGLVICSFGLTAWEALAAGCAVLTVAPSRCHAGLSKHCRIPGLGPPKITADGILAPRSLNRLAALLGNPAALVEAAQNAARPLSPAPETRLGPMLDALEAPPPRCALCGTLLPRVIARFPRRSVYRCQSCRVMGLYRFEGGADQYGAAYFEEDYKKQYGKTYLEDFKTIKGMAGGRLAAIRRRVSSGSLLDIGCAYGPFLEAAAESGFEARGIDASEEAARYVTDRLGIPAAAASFPSPEALAVLGPAPFDAVTLWYVIEHFPNLAEVLGALSRLVRVGGVLALSTPNAAGISARLSLKGFLRASPADHYSFWTPRSAPRILRRFGFKIYRIRRTGHHPERFPGNPKPGNAAYRIAMRISRLFGLGDTFEIYAVKTKLEAQ